MLPTMWLEHNVPATFFMAVSLERNQKYQMCLHTEFYGCTNLLCTGLIIAHPQTYGLQKNNYRWWDVVVLYLVRVRAMLQLRVEGG